MGFTDIFRRPGMKEYKQIADKNNGTVAILFELKKNKDAAPIKKVVMTNNHRGFTIKTNELKRVKSSFDSMYETSADTYCKFAPVDEEFDLTEDNIRLKKSGEIIDIKKVPYYDGLLARNLN